MKVVTVRQPFASLIVVGAKTLLDQARPAGYRGRLLIRAGLTLADFDDYPAVEAKYRLPISLPRGVVVASCELVDCVPTEELHWRWNRPGEQRRVIGPRDPERRYGDLTAGRWAWLLDDVRPTTERCPRCWDAPPTAAPGVCVDIDGGWWHEPGSCPHCAGACPTCHGGTRRVEPVRMRGGPGLRTPEWEAR